MVHVKPSYINMYTKFIRVPDNKVIALRFVSVVVTIVRNNRKKNGGTGEREKWGGGEANV